MVNLLKTKFDKNNIKSSIIDGDTIRDKRTKKLGFSKSDINSNNLEIVKEAKKKIKVNNYVMISVIAPLNSQRLINRKLLGEYYREIYVKCSVKEAIRRDPKGLYAKALNGEINNLIGFSPSNSFEEPINPDLIIDTTKSSEKDCVDIVTSFLGINI